MKRGDLSASRSNLDGGATSFSVAVLRFSHATMLRAIFARRHAVAAAGFAAATGATGAIAYCDAVAKDKVPPFVLGGDKYDQSDFGGRLQKIQEIIDFRTVLTTDEDLAAAQARLAEFKKLGKLPAGVSDADMWESQRVVDAIIHGPTGEKMMIAGRMSMFVPMNLIPTSGMIMARSTPAILFWQWMNQTYNVVNNYTCRAGPEVAYGPLAQSYALAVTASCSIAIGAKKMLATFPRLQAFGLLVPYFAVISAGTCNVRACSLLLACCLLLAPAMTCLLLASCLLGVSASRRPTSEYS